VVQLAVGDVIPADLRLFEGMNTTTDEALLTGESLPAVKKPYDVFSSRDMPIGDRANMAYSGSTMAQGRARGIVIATGMMTEVGKIANLLRDEGSYSSSSNAILRVWFRFRAKLLEVLGLVGTPLQVKLSIFALLLFALAIFLVIIVFSVALWDLQGEVIIYGISVGVAVIPESLIAVLTITIAVGTKAMAKGNVIVRKLQSLEAVGGVTNICSDKTGTLTQGRMVVRSAWVPNAGLLTVHDTSHPFDPRSGTVKVNGEIIRGAQKDTVSQWTSFLTGLALCNLSSVFVDDDHQSSEKTVSGWAAIGEPTEIALQVLAMRFDHGKATLLEDGNLQLVAEHPFDSGIKRMIVVYHNKRENTHEVYAKGATEVLLSIVAMDQSAKTEVHDRAERMAAEGLRVLCIAKKTLAAEDSDQLKERDKAEAGLEFVGLVGIYDPPRPETADAVLKCQMAGITVHMLTGDHIRTATAIAYEVGILGSYMRSVRPSTAIMAATDFDKLSDAEIDDMETLPLVIARCSPSTKVRMVEAMHRRTAFCVMTGDGVNDSPALHRADVGIAMGKAGSDVAKEASDMVLADDDFSSIVKAVEEGRRLFDNIQKVGSPFSAASDSPTD
jgi:Na+-exporting ATPase